MENIIHYFANFFDGTKEHTVQAAQVTLVLSVGAFLTSCLSILIAYKALRSGEKKNKRDIFYDGLKQREDRHKQQLDVVIQYLDETDSANKVTGKQWFAEFFKNNDHHQSFEILHKNKRIIPYLDVLFDLLKYIDGNFYSSRGRSGEQKKIIASFRAQIRNDVLFLVASNASYLEGNGSRKECADYHRLLNKYDFFANTSFFEIDSEQSHHPSLVANRTDIDHFMTRIISGTSARFDRIFGYQCNYPVPAFFSLPRSFILSCIYSNPFYETCMDTLAKVPDQVLTKIEKKGMKKLLTVRNKFKLVICL